MKREWKVVIVIFAVSMIVVIIGLSILTFVMVNFIMVPKDEPLSVQDRWQIVDAYYTEENYTNNLGGESYITAKYLGENDAVNVGASGESYAWYFSGYTFGTISKGETIQVEWHDKVTSMTIRWEPGFSNYTRITANFTSDDIQLRIIPLSSPLWHPQKRIMEVFGDKWRS